MKIRNQKGQIALFIAMIFQVLFLFFAMVINVGLLVHHKINLQNSVDIGAYYAAGKQAEMLGAIGHINYQIRQSWKLLAWRYRVLGTAGVEPPTSPVNKQGGIGIISNPQSDDEDPTATKYDTDFYNLPSFCVTFKPFQECPPNENTCRNPAGLSIAAISVPSVIAPWVPGLSGVISAAHAAQQAVYAQCVDNGSFNYLTVARFYVAWTNDVADRKSMIMALAKNMSNSTNDFKDISDASVLDGVRNTIVNNLTNANQSGLGSISMHNSLADENCKSQPSGETSTAVPPKWLRDIETLPIFSFTDASCGTSGSVSSQVRQITGPATNPFHASQAVWSAQVNEIRPLFTSRSDYHRNSMGYEKNPWCMAYVGVKADATPNIPFGVGKIKLTAKAFAKPFGGRIGPWYGKKWGPSDETSYAEPSNPETRVDSNLSVRASPGSISSDQRQQLTGANYARFPGDRLGMKSRRVQAEFGKALHSGYTPAYSEWVNIEKEVPDMGDRSGDILAWGINSGEASQTRKLEIAAVTPDLFDITYYTIDNDYYYHYYKGKLEKFFANNSNLLQNGASLRYDFGSYGRTETSGNTTLLSSSMSRPGIAFSVANQIYVAGSLKGSGNQGFNLNFSDELKYAIAGTEDKLQFSLLTSWIPKGPKDYTLDERRIATCSNDTASMNITNIGEGGQEAELKRVPGGCLTDGGRSGYSVKIVSKSYLMGDHVLGGEDTTAGKIKNPPPLEF